MTVLGASALLALIHDESGADLVAEAMIGSVIGTPNLADVIGKLVDAQIDASAVRQLVVAAGVTIEPLTADDARRSIGGVLRIARARQHRRSAHSLGVDPYRPVTAALTAGLQGITALNPTRCYRGTNGLESPA